MRQWLTLLMCVAAWFSSGALAQNWIHYAPPEGDFRVLLPAAPARQNAANGSVEFRAEGGEHKYSIFRHNPASANTIEQARAISQARVTDDETSTRRVRRETPDLGQNEYEFRVRGVHYIHRVIMEGGRYYELVVQAPTGEDAGLHLQSVRDFFSSFQMGQGLGRGFGLLRNVPTPDTCAARPNAYARRFCEYVTCLAPGQEANPICTALPRLRLQ